MRQITLRLKENQDVRNEIENIVIKKDIRAAIIASLVGSLKKAVLRMPILNAEDLKTETWDEPLEIVSGTGTLSKNGNHIHIE